MISRPGSLISLELWRVDSSEVRLGVKSAQSEGEPHLVGSYQEKSYWGGIRINQSKKVSGKILVGWGAGGVRGRLVPDDPLALEKCGRLQGNAC